MRYYRIHFWSVIGYLNSTIIFLYFKNGPVWFNIEVLKGRLKVRSFEPTTYLVEVFESASLPMGQLASQKPTNLVQ